MTKPVAFEGAERLPVAIADLLTHFIRRARRLIVLRGIGAGCTAALGAFLTVMLIDANLTLAAAWGRWLLTGLAYLGVAAAILWFLVRPLARSFTLAGVARLVEQKHPELHERISSAVELLTSRDLPSLRGSDVLIQELAKEAVRDVGTIRPKEELSWHLAIPFLISAGILAAAMGGLLLVRPRETMVLFARAAAPFLNLSNVKALTLVVTPGDTLIAAGAPLTIQVKTANKRVEAARVRQTDRQGRGTTLHMVPVVGGTNGHSRAFTLTLPNVVQNFRYRIQAGGALTRHYAVRVAVAPAIQRQDVSCTYPAYTRLPEWHERDGAGTIRAVAGTAVAVTATVNKPVPTAELLVISGSRTNVFSGTVRAAPEATAYEFAFVLPAGVDGLWTIRLRDEIGLENKPFENTIQTLPDLPPSVHITNLRQREFRLNRTDRLPVRYAAGDDLGLAQVDLITTIGGATNTFASQLAGPTNAAHVLRAIEGGLEIDLSAARYARAPRLDFHLLARDSLPAGLGGPQTGRSETVTILLEAAAPSWKEQVLESQEQRIRKGVAEVEKQLKDAETKSAALSAPIAKPGPLPDQALTQTAALQDALAAVDTNLRRLAGEIAGGFFEALATNLSAVADAHVAPAERLAGEMRLVDTPAERMSINSNVTADVQSAVRAVNEMAQQFERAQEPLQRAVALEQMARKQERLALEKQAMEEAANAAPTQAPTAGAVAEAKAWEQEQERLAAEIAKLALAAEGAGREVATLISNQSAIVAAEARKLAERQAENAEWMRDAAAAGERLSKERAALATQQQQLATEAAARGDPANRQADIREQTGQLTEAENQGRAETLNALAGQVGEMQQALAAEAEALAQALAAAAAPAAPPAGQAAAQAREAAQEWQKDDRIPAREAATRAQTGLDQLADTLAEAARAGAADAAVPPAEQVERTQQARQADALAGRQAALGEQMGVIASGQLMQALANQQALLGADTEALNEQAAVLHDQATAFRAELPAMQQPAALAAQHAARADQQSELADSAAQQAARSALEAPKPGAPLPAAQAAQNARTAAQHQDAAAQALVQAAQSLAALAAGAPAPKPPAEDPAPGLESMAAAHEAALQAAASRQALAAAEASAQLAQAADEAAAAAAAQGVNPQPPDLRMAAGGTGGSKPFTDAENTDFTDFANRFDPRLRDWLRLHGELEHDVLQAQGAEGPEEYRTIIKRYFREVTRRGSEENEP